MSQFIKCGEKFGIYTTILKMDVLASTRQQKKEVTRFIETQSTTIVRRIFQTKYDEEPQVPDSILR